MEFNKWQHLFSELGLYIDRLKVAKIINIEYIMYKEGTENFYLCNCVGRRGKKRKEQKKSMSMWNRQISSLENNWLGWNLEIIIKKHLTETKRGKNRLSIIKNFLKINSRKMNNHFPDEVKQLKLYSPDYFDVHGQKYFRFITKSRTLNQKKKLKVINFLWTNISVFLHLPKSNSVLLVFYCEYGSEYWRLK